MTTEPIVKSVHVPLTPAAAFDLFTARMGTWWPVESHSVSAGQGAPSQSLTLDGGLDSELVEVKADGKREVWGKILEWVPGEAFRMTWHPGKLPAEATEVRVTFTASGGGTEVVLTHSGWEALGDEGAKSRGGYNEGWVGVLERFVKAA